MRNFTFRPTATGKFQPGDVIRVVGATSLEWLKPIPLVVLGYHWPNQPHVMGLNGEDPTTDDRWINHGRDEDCVLDVFLTAARKANQ